ncbi:MAG: hemolysin family protein, partial [Campylobacter hyointestinalis]
MVILAAVFIFLNGFFVLSEFSIVKVRKSRLEELVKDKVPNAKLAYKMSNSLDTYLSATQLGITLSSLALGWIGEPAVANLIEAPLKTYFGIDGVAVHTIAFIIAFTLITLLHVVLGELVPKSVAIAKAEKSVLFIAKPLYMFWVIFFPVIRTFDFIASLSLKAIGIKPAKDSELAHSEEEIKIIVGESLKGGVLDSMESEIIKNAVDFSDTVAKEIMTPRKDMVCLNKQKSFEENMKVIEESKYTRFPY